MIRSFTCGGITRPGWSALKGLALFCLVCLFSHSGSLPAFAQAAPETQVSPEPFGNITVVPRNGGAEPESVAGAPIRLVAQLTADGQRIEQGLVWRIYRHEPNPQDGKVPLINTVREASPTVSLAPGEYVINASFGKAHLTRVVTVKPATGAEPVVEPFVINAGGLRIAAELGGQQIPEKLISINIYSDRDMQDTAKLVMQGVKPGVILRLNAGIYYLVSTYGDANANVRSDVTVEAGKLTEAQIAHTAGKVTFKLVQRAGGEAIADTQWLIQRSTGEEVKTSVGALPTHILLPGSYSVIATSQGQQYQRDFKLENGETTQVEVVISK